MLSDLFSFSLGGVEQYLHFKDQVAALYLLVRTFIQGVTHIVQPAGLKKKLASLKVHK